MAENRVLVVKENVMWQLIKRIDFSVSGMHMGNKPSSMDDSATAGASTARPNITIKSSSRILVRLIPVIMRVRKVVLWRPDWRCHRMPKQATSTKQLYVVVKWSEVRKGEGNGLDYCERGWIECICKSRIEVRIILESFRLLSL